MKKTVISPFYFVWLAIAIPIFIGVIPGTQNSPFLGVNSAHADYSLYQQHCASCHGVNLEGEPNWRNMKADGTLPAPPHDETGHTWHHDDELLFNYTKFGGEGLAKKFGLKDFKSGMPAFEQELSDKEIISILEYIKSTWPDDIKQAQASR